MPLPNPSVGTVIRYSYLWEREHGQGAEEGRKDRPCAIVVMSTDAKCYVCPITHTSPDPELGQIAIEIPKSVNDHLGLDDDQSWVIVSEMNVFRWPGPDVRPMEREEGAYGRVPYRLREIIRDAVYQCQNERTLRLIDRE